MKKASLFMAEMKELVDHHLKSIGTFEYTKKHAPDPEIQNLAAQRLSERKGLLSDLEKKVRIMGDKCLEDAMMKSIAREFARPSTENHKVTHLKLEQNLLIIYDRILRNAYLGGELKAMIIEHRNSVQMDINELENIQVQQLEEIIN